MPVTVCYFSVSRIQLVLTLVSIMMMSYIYTGGTCISYCARSCLCEYNPFLITDKAHHTLFDFPFSNVLPSFFFFFLFVVIDGLFLPGLVHVRVHY